MIVGGAAPPSIVINSSGPTWWTLLVVALIGAVASAIAAYATYRATTTAERERRETELLREEGRRSLLSIEHQRGYQREAVDLLEHALLRLHDHAARTYFARNASSEEQLRSLHELNALEIAVTAAASHVDNLAVAQVCLSARGLLYEAAKSATVDQFAARYDAANHSLRQALTRLGRYRHALYPAVLAGLEPETRHTDSGLAAFEDGPTR